VIGKRVPKGRRRSVVKEYFHMSRLSRSRHETLFGMLQDEFDLFARYPGKPLQEFINAGAAFQIFKQRTHGDARTLEKPFAATFAGHALDRRTFRPIQHTGILGWPLDHDKVVALCLGP
jgi:hypothetical protein